MKTWPIEGNLKDSLPDRKVFGLFPLNFMQRHRLLPLEIAANILTVGFVEDPTPPVLAGVRQHVPGMEVQPVRISLTFFRDAIDARLDLDETQVGFASPRDKAPKS